MHRIRIAFFLMAIVTTLSCAPTMRNYYQPQYNGGELYSSGCGSSGPSDSLKVELPNQANFTIRATSRKPGKLDNFYLLLTYNLPENVTLELINPYIVVSSNGDELLHYSIKEWVTLKDMDTVFVPSSGSISGDTTNMPNWFGSRNYYKGFSVSLTSKLPNEYDSFTITLPAIKINSVTIETKKIIFKNIQHLGIDPLNC